MKNYYIGLSVNYKDSNEGNPYDDSEFYQFIIRANSKICAEKEAKEEAIKQFIEDIGNKDMITCVKIEESYATTEDARAS